MAIDASALLGSPQLAGVKVNPRGLGKAVGAQASGASVGGALGAAVSAARGQRAEKERAQYASASRTPEFGRLAYLAVTDSEVALITLKSGLVTVKLDEVIARRPRGDLVSAVLGKGVSTAPLTITLADGETWELEVPGPSKKHARGVVEVLVPTGDC
jgi:hypothetical protein